MTQTSVEVMGVTGHQNIPEQALPFLQSEIKKILFSFDRVECVTSLAVGADQLLAKCVLENGGSVHAVIPCENYEETFDSNYTLQAYNFFLAKASIVDILHHKNPSEDAFYDAGCRVADLSEILLAIWDGKKANGKGGTADIVEYAKSKGKKVIVLWPEGLNR